MGRKEKMAADPQNSFWANDTSKFGRKMLERMGWAEGRGLGADGQGTTTHVEVVRKADNAGIGVATEHADNWLVHNDNLNDILAMLNEQYAAPSTATTAVSATSATDPSAPPSAAAAEQRQLSGYHRMYRKRVQNKDVSRYSSADVAQILGLPPASSGAPAKRKRPDDATATTAADGDGDDARPMLGAAASASTAAADDVVETSAHITSSVSVSDYFSSKMRLLGGFLPATNDADKVAPSRSDSAAKRRAVEPAGPTAKEARKAEKKAAKKLAKKEAKRREKKAAKKSAQVKRARG
jgi:Pin2-interacting protein X1